ncbi:MAG: nucleotidyltransferase family protein [Candidatus Eremiobacteraeota bacterium]|nr:nucleotidyltransferase family protein [Candidatus Eremiobacteraeota bacterium]
MGLAPTPALSRLDEVVKLLAGGSGRPRLAMRGQSMHPRFREGMVLELTPFSRATARRGDVVVFREPQRLVAHRIVAIEPAHLVTSGDAQPWTLETVPDEAVIGTVGAVLSDPMPNARRLAGAAFHARGRVYMHTRQLRAAFGHARFFARRILRALPGARAPRFERLLSALTAYVHRDTAFNVEISDAADVRETARFAYRQGCTALFRETLAFAAPSRHSEALAAELATQGRLSGVRQFAIRTQVGRVVKQFGEHGIPFVLLKGAARMYADTPDVFLFPSHDVDVLVPRRDLDRAFALFLVNGYRCEYSAAEQERYRLEHHHAAPLYPPKGEPAPLELHVTLTPPGMLSTASDWDALISHTRTIEGPQGPALALDAFGNTLHHALHCVGFERLRDIVVCAQGLRAMSAAERDELAALAASESRDPVRLGAVLELAARVAGVAWPKADPDALAYLRWVAARENMPRSIGTRSQTVEAWYAARRRWNALDPRIVNSWSDEPLRVAARYALVPAGLAYAAGQGQP